MTPQQKKNRILLVGIFALSIVPFMIAWRLSLNTEWLSSRRTTNNGELIQPPVMTERTDLSAYDDTALPKMQELPGRWLIANVIPKPSCSAVCLQAILQTRQLQLMLNKDMLRTRRIVVVFDKLDSEAASQLWLKEALMWRLLDAGNKEDATANNDALLYDGLLSPDKKVDETLLSRLVGEQNGETALQSELVKVAPSPALRKKMAEIRKGDIPEGMLFLIDPLGNIMMQYEPGFDPYKVKSDLMQLLRISQIG